MKSLIPWGSQNSLLDSPFEHYFDNLFKDTAIFPLLLRQNKFQPRLDLVETEENIQITAELPGMTEKDIKIKVHNNMLVIQGEKKQEQVEKEKNYCYTERHYGAFQRSIPLPETIKEDAIQAKFKNRVLEINMPKCSPKTKEIEIECVEE